MSESEIIERLRKASVTHDYTITDEAADLIEQQAKQLESAKQSAKENGFSGDCMSDIIDLMAKEIAELTTKLVYAEDAAAKGDKARQSAGRMEMEIAELHMALHTAKDFLLLFATSSTEHGRKTNLQSIRDTINQAIDTSRNNPID